MIFVLLIAFITLCAREMIAEDELDSLQSRLSGLKKRHDVWNIGATLGILSKDASLVDLVAELRTQTVRMRDLDNERWSALNERMQCFESRLNMMEERQNGAASVHKAKVD